MSNLRFSLRFCGVALVCLGLARPAVAQQSSVLSAVAVVVSDLDAATTYYTDLLGMENARTFETEDLRENILRLPGPRGAALVLVQYRDPERGPGRSTRLVFRVPDPAAVVERARSAGSEVVREPAPVAALGGVMGMIRDPDGYLVELIQLPSAAPGTE